MQYNEAINLDNWRMNRAKNRRDEDNVIDQLCDALFQSQIRCAELERQLKEYSEIPK